MKTRIVPPRRFGCRRQEGAALISALLMLLVVTVLGLALNTLSATDVSVSVNTQDSQEALALAESGFAHARAIVTWPALEPTDFLKAGDDKIPCSGDELEGKFDKKTKVPKDFPKASDLIAAGGRTFAGGSYKIAVCDDNATELAMETPDSNPLEDKNSTILIRSTGTGRNGSSSTIEVAFGPDDGLSAISVNGYLRIEDKIRVTGVHGGIYSTGIMELENEPCTETRFMASGDIKKPEHSRRGPDCKSKGRTQPFSPTTTFPKLLPGDYINTKSGPPFPKAYDYFLSGDGKVYDTNGAFLSASPWKDNHNKEMWKWEVDKWLWTAKKEMDYKPGFYYTDANIKIDEDPGKNNPIKLTLIAEGYIEIDGALEFTPAVILPECLKCVGMNIPAIGIGMIAGTDIKIKNKPKLAGVIYARDQIRVEGDFSLVGQLLAFNEADALSPNNKKKGKQLVAREGKEMKILIKGNGNVSYGGNGFTPNGDVGPSILAWRECRGANPASPCS